MKVRVAVLGLVAVLATALALVWVLVQAVVQAEEWELDLAEEWEQESE